MIKSRLIGVALFLGGWMAAGAPALSAPVLSVTTLSFLAETRPSNAFLIDSSRLAEGQAERATIRAFARREMAGRADVLTAFAAWASAATHRAEAAAARLDPLSRALAPAGDRVVIDAALPSPDVSRLAALRGQDFDAAYVSEQTQVLDRIVAAYVDFILNGDDEGLRALAVRDLPRARLLLAAARRLR